MPAAIPWITLAITAVTSGVGIEKAITAPKPPDLNAAMQKQASDDAAAQAKQDAATKAQLLRRSAPDAQAATGGSLTEAPFAQLTSDIAGQPGDIQTALKLLGQRGGGGEDTSNLSFSGGF